jgi:Tol biopolymer transport system component
MKMAVMKHPVTYILLLLLLIFPDPSWTQNRPNGDDLLSSAIYEEEINGDLQKAIEIYQSIIDHHPSFRQITAESLWRLGLIHEKLGLEDGLEYYRILEVEYKDQPTFSNKARSRLNQLVEALQDGDNSLEITPATASLTTKKVFSKPDFYGTISPDGQFFSYTHWESGNLIVHNRATDEVEIVTDDASWTTGEWCDRSIWSPDNSKVAYCWIIERVGTQIRVYDSELDDIHNLTPVQEKTMLWPIEWSRDGQYILASKFDQVDRRGRFVLVSALDGSIEVVKLIPKGESCSGCRQTISPDGKFIAYTKVIDASKRDVFLLSTDGQIDRPLLQDPSIKNVANFHPNGRSLLYYSDISGSKGLWKAYLSPDYHIERTELLIERIAEEVWTIGMTDEGAYYYMQTGFAGNLFSVEFDPETSTLGDPETIATGDPTPRVSPFWSPGGQELGYFRTDPGGETKIEIRDMDTGHERIVDIQVTNIEGIHASGANARWRNKKQELLVTYDEDEYTQIGLADLSTGEVQFITRGWFPKDFDGSDKMYCISDGDILEVDINTGQKTSIFQADFGQITALKVSPDGQMLAFLKQNATDLRQQDLHVYWPSDGSIRTFIAPQGGEYMAIGGLNWLHDGGRLLVAVLDEESLNQQLYILDSRSGEHTKLGQPISRSSQFMQSIRIHPLRNLLVFGMSEEMKNIWALENF